MHLDVRSYFPSIDLEILRGLIGRQVRDRRFLAVVDRILEAGRGFYDPSAIRLVARIDRDWPRPGQGLPIGALTSQVFAAHLYLSELDHRIKRVWKVPGYLRYVDDLVLFDNDERRLVVVRDEIAAWLLEARRLRLKVPKARVRSTFGTLWALGHGVSLGGIRPRPRSWRSFRAALRNVVREGGGDERFSGAALRSAVASRIEGLLFGV